MTVTENTVPAGAGGTNTVPAGAGGTNAVAVAAEAVIPAASRAERFTGYEVEAFEVPGGREENWRFTPMKRLRGLHDGSAVADGEIKVEADAAPEVRVETVGREDERLGRAGVPSDRIAAQAYSSFTDATLGTLPKETRASKPTVLRLTGPGEGNTAYGHVQVRAEAYAEGVVV